jgi:glycine betaine catabolism A
MSMDSGEMTTSSGALTDGHGASTELAIEPFDARVVRFNQLRSRRREKHALEGAFSTDAGIHALELEHIWRKSWLFAGHSAELPCPGDIVVVELGDDSVIVARSRSGALRAVHNTCRHRGMRLAEGPARVSRLVCPYHQWTFDLDGTLLWCGGMDRTGEIADTTDYALAPAAVEEVGGLIWINLDDSPPPFAAEADMRHALAPQGLEHAKVAAYLDYDVAADWKLVWENNRECWHCHAGHPEYIRANFDVAPDDPDADRRAAEIAGDAHADGAAQPAEGLFVFPTADRWWSANRTPLRRGWVTESMDGAAVAPLMGRYRQRDMGTLRVRTLPNFWCHASSDHVVTTRLLPAGAGHTQIRVTWLVDADAVEGRDYDLSALLPFWQITSEQDWALCERNQAGVRSPAFRPGPYSLRREGNVMAFVEWYLAAMGAGVAP